MREYIGGIGYYGSSERLPRCRSVDISGQRVHSRKTHLLPPFASTFFSRLRLWWFSLWHLLYCLCHCWYAPRTYTKSCKVRPKSHSTQVTRNTFSDHPVTWPSIVSKSATDQEIRKAYKRLSKKYHPDKNQSPGAEEKFVEIAHGTMDPCLVTEPAALCFRPLKLYLLSLRSAL